VKYVLTIIAMIVLTELAAAQHTHGSKGPNGGQMEDVAGVHAELLTDGNTITINVFDQANKPVSTNGFAASAVVARGSEREAVPLTPSAENALKGDAKKAIAGAVITVTLKTAAGKTGQARFQP
jgi:nitrogen fixation protein FixH